MPSIGSITQRRGPQPVSAISSPCTASRGRARPRVRRIASSAAVSASETGVRSGLEVTCRSSDLNRLMVIESASSASRWASRRSSVRPRWSAALGPVARRRGRACALRYWPEPSIRRNDSSRAADSRRVRRQRRARTPGVRHRGCSRAGSLGDDAARSSKAAMIRSRLTWLSPKERTPGVSITQPSRRRPRRVG